MSLSSTKGGESETSKEKAPIPPGSEPSATGPIDDIDGKKLIANGATDDDSLLTKSVCTTTADDGKLRAVSSVSSTVIEHIVIPNPHSILTQLSNAASDHCTRSQAKHNEEGISAPAASATPATNSSTVSLSSGTSSSTET